MTMNQALEHPFLKNANCSRNDKLFSQIQDRFDKLKKDGRIENLKWHN